MIISNEFYVFNSSIVKSIGNKYMLLIDFQRNKYYKFCKNDIPNIVYLGTERTDIFINQLKSDLEVEIFDLLLADDIILKSRFPERFIELNMEWDEPFQITNTIIDVNELELNIVKILNELILLKVPHLQLRFFGEIDGHKFISFFEANSYLIDSFDSIELIARYNDFYTEDVLSNLTLRIRNITSFILYNSPFTTAKRYNDKQICEIIYVETLLLNSSSCGLIDMSFFTPNIKHITESITHNSCLNRKVSIDLNGNIKNCPSMTKSYGNIRDTLIADAIEKPGFKDLWDINKDKIHVCKDCEYRYICTDCRAYTEDPSDILSKPLKCGYNPYTGEWGEWSTNPLKQKAIDFYGMRDIVDAINIESS